VIPNHALGGKSSPIINQQFHIHGATDTDCIKKNQSQIMRDFGRRTQNCSRLTNKKVRTETQEGRRGVVIRVALFLPKRKMRSDFQYAQT
jgi:hypothetical protein